VRAADFIAFNISEGYGRFHYKDNKKFCYYSRGSAKETLTAIQKASSRNLISPGDYQLPSEKLTLYFKLSFSYIKSIGSPTNP